MLLSTLSHSPYATVKIFDPPQHSPYAAGAVCGSVPLCIGVITKCSVFSVFGVAMQPCLKSPMLV